MRVWLSLNPKTCDKFDHCNYYHLFSQIAKNNFPVANGVCLAHLLVTTKLCNCHIPLNEISKGLTPKYIGKLFDIYQLSIIKFYLQKFEVCTLWGELRSHYPLPRDLTAPFSLELLVSFSIFETLFCIAATINKPFLCVGNVLSLTYLSVASIFYSSSISLNGIWPCLHPKYFGKSSHIYQQAL